MKKLILIFSVVVVSGLLAVNQVDAQTISYKQDLPWSQYIPCANDGEGEWIIGTLNLHWVLHFNKDGDLTKWHAQPQGTAFIGESTGMVYHGGGVNQWIEDKKPAGDGAYTYTRINRYHFVGKGIQFFVKQSEHITINANGVLTSHVDNSVIECK